MADFYPLLDRAIRGLPDNTREARNALFARARDVLIAQLRGMDPPLEEREIAHELAALDAVIARVEHEQAPTPAVSSPPPPVAAQAASPPPSAPGNAIPASAPIPASTSTPMPGATTSGPVVPAPGMSTPSTAGAPPGPVDAAKPASQLGHTGIRPANGAVPADKVSAAPTPRPAQSEIKEDPEEARLRPPPARASGADGKGRRNALIGGLLAVALIAVAGAAYWANKVNAPEPQQAELPPAGATDLSNEQKFGQRVDSGRAGQQAAQPGQAVEGSQRAILYEETPESPQTPKVLQGRVTWRLDSENPGQNQPLENVVRADVTIPEAGLDLQITLRRNTDAALPASHLMELTFRKSAGGEGRVIRDIGVPQFKTEENARGVPLAGLPVAVSETVFLVGLSNLPNDIERNMDLIRNRPWIDLPVRYDNGRRAVIALEKGPSGDKVISEAFAAWGAGK